MFLFFWISHTKKVQNAFIHDEISSLYKSKKILKCRCDLLFFTIFLKFNFRVFLQFPQKWQIWHFCQCFIWTDASIKECIPIGFIPPGHWAHLLVSAGGDVRARGGMYARGRMNAYWGVACMPSCWQTDTFENTTFANFMVGFEREKLKELYNWSLTIILHISPFVSFHSYHWNNAGISWTQFSLNCFYFRFWSNHKIWMVFVINI